MTFFGQFQSVGSAADGGKPSGSGSAVDRIADLLQKKIYYERRILPFTDESRYLTPLIVFGNEEPSDSQSITTSFELRAKVSNHLEIKDKIRSALKFLSVRDPHSLIQFWSPRVVGRHQILTTVDHFFGLGEADERLCLYRRESEHNLIIVDKDHEEDDLSPPARVFRRGLPEWTPDITNYLPKNFPQQECAIRCNLFGFLALPVFDSTTRSCVGVLELLMSSKNINFAYEAKQVHAALKTTNLTAPLAFDIPPNVRNESRQNELYKILGILKVLCDIHNLPLAQTWVVFPFGSYVSHKNVLEKSCNSFNIGCVGKICMSTTDLPFHVQDLSMWSFREACEKQHLEKSRGFVGRALLSRTSCLCRDITKLSKEEYPLVHNARMSGLTSCFAIFLHSVGGDGDDYVLEFFLPSDIKEDRHVLNMVQTLKQNFEVTSGFELGDISSIEVVGPPREVCNMSLNAEPRTIQISSTEMDSEPIVANFDTTGRGNVPSQWSLKHNSPIESGILTDREILAGDDVVSNHQNVVGARKKHKVSMQRTRDAGEKRSSLTQGVKRKSKLDSPTLGAVQQQLETPIREAATRPGVGRSCFGQKEISPSKQALQGSSIQHAMPSRDYPPGDSEDHLQPLDLDFLLFSEQSEANIFDKQPGWLDTFFNSEGSEADFVYTPVELQCSELKQTPNIMTPRMSSEPKHMGSDFVSSSERSEANIIDLGHITDIQNSFWPYDLAFL